MGKCMVCNLKKELTRIPMNTGGHAFVCSNCITTTSRDDIRKSYNELRKRFVWLMGEYIKEINQREVNHE